MLPANNRCSFVFRKSPTYIFRCRGPPHDYGIIYRSWKRVRYTRLLLGMWNRHCTADAIPLHPPRKPQRKRPVFPGFPFLIYCILPNNNNSEKFEWQGTKEMEKQKVFSIKHIAGYEKIRNITTYENIRRKKRKKNKAFYLRDMVKKFLLLDAQCTARFRNFFSVKINFNFLV